MSISTLVPNLNKIKPNFYDNLNYTDFKELQDATDITSDQAQKILKDNFIHYTSLGIIHNFRTNNENQVIIPFHQYSIDRKFNESLFMVNPHNNKTVFETTKKVIDLF